MSSLRGACARIAATGAAIALLAGQSSAAQAACTWSVVPTVNPGANFNIFGAVSATSKTNAWAVGYYSISSTETGALAERWNGSVWKVVPTQNPSANQTVFFGVKALANNNAWAVGYYQTASNLFEPISEHWNGNKWTVVNMPPAPAPNGGYMNSVDAVSPTDIWAVGLQIPTSVGYQTFAEHWNGTKWSVVTTPNVNGFNQILQTTFAVGTSDVWAGGYYTLSSGIKQNLSMHWNGVKWTIVPMKDVGSSNNFINGMGGFATNGVFAVGTHRNTSENGPNTLSEGWNSTKWAVQSSPNDGSLTTAFEAVVASTSEGALAVGLVNPVTGQQFQIPYAALWNGTKWVQSLPVAAGTYGSFFNSASLIPGTHDFWAAGGAFDSAGNFNALTTMQMLQCP
ncbi:MAG TPA: hypothetical protein VKT51_00195 [Candidatus Eremiobacteraceae bacterium]|nr:hypothetical protein [Candidatus Eremiobacteraceae bacterium]